MVNITKTIRFLPLCFISFFGCAVMEPAFSSHDMGGSTNDVAQGLIKSGLFSVYFREQRRNESLVKNKINSFVKELDKGVAGNTLDKISSENFERIYFSRIPLLMCLMEYINHDTFWLNLIKNSSYISNLEMKKVSAKLLSENGFSEELLKNIDEIESKEVVFPPMHILEAMKIRRNVNTMLQRITANNERLLSCSFDIFLKLINISRKLKCACNYVSFVDLPEGIRIDISHQGSYRPNGQESIPYHLVEHGHFSGYRIQSEGRGLPNKFILWDDNIAQLKTGQEVNLPFIRIIPLPDNDPASSIIRCRVEVRG